MKKMFLVDGSNHAFRVHFALPPMHASTGFPTRALYGFTMLFAKLLRVHKPDYVVVSFDRGASFRQDLFPDYKGHRPEMPDDLAQQWPHFDKLVEGFGYRCLAVEGYEADDVLGTLARRFAGPDLEVRLVTGDKDFAQLVDGQIHILDLMKDEELGPAEVEAKFGLPPERIVDMLALSGDKSDNIPGVPGVGDKTAAKWLQKYGDLEAVLGAADDIGGKRGKALEEHAEAARLSGSLATIRTDVPLDVTLEDLEPRGMQVEALRELFDRWEFGKVARKLLPEQPALSRDHYRSICDEAALEALAGELRAAGRFSFDLETTSLDPLQAEIVGLAFCWGEEQAAYVPLRHLEGPQCDPERGMALLRPLLEDPQVGKFGQNLKYDLMVCRGNGIDLRGIDGDTLLLDYVLVAHERSHGLDAMARRYLGHDMVSYGEVSQGESLGFAEVDISEATRYAAEDAHVAWLIEARNRPRLEGGLQRIYEEIEVPLIPVLAEMELTGIRLDRQRLEEVKADVDERLRGAEARCHELAGRVFNVNSRHEIADVLFGEQGEFTPTKKVKDGWSTDSSVLEKLADGQNLPASILAYRQLQKLKGTYLDKLPTYLKADGRIHSSFNQAVAATGRLSSADPNLQNIPVRTFEGRRIRECFVPEAGHLFLAADYSQVEIRILAHMSEEPALLESFRRGEDIHRRTAAEVFGLDPEQVTREQRSAAKAINFGLLYGMSAFRLAGDLSIPREEAREYMDRYFGRMPRVAAWLEEARGRARRLGYAETLFGRRRILPTIHASNYNERTAAEREAVNSVIQGTAADIIKLAMLRVWRMLQEQGLRSRMLLQVHDELLLEVPEDEVDVAREAVVREMECAAELRVPLAVNSAVGRNWNEAHG